MYLNLVAKSRLATVNVEPFSLFDIKRSSFDNFIFHFKQKRGKKSKTLKTKDTDMPYCTVELIET